MAILVDHPFNSFCKNRKVGGPFRRRGDTVDDGRADIDVRGVYRDLPELICPVGRGG
jgi:hypothetical protein